MPYCKFNMPHHKHGINSNNFLLLNLPCQWSKHDCWELRTSLAHVAHKPHFGKKYQFLRTQVNKLHKRIKENRHKQTNKQNFSLMHMHIPPLNSTKPDELNSRLYFCLFLFSSCCAKTHQALQSIFQTCW